MAKDVPADWYILSEHTGSFLGMAIGESGNKYATTLTWVKSGMDLCVNKDLLTCSILISGCCYLVRNW